MKKSEKKPEKWVLKKKWSSLHPIEDKNWGKTLKNVFQPLIKNVLFLFFITARSFFRSFFLPKSVL